MARNVSLAMEDEARGSHTDRVYAFTASFSHPTLQDPIQLTNNGEPVTIVAPDGRTFTPFRFQIQLPDDQEDAIAEGRLVISSIALDRTMVNAVRQAGDPPIQVELRLVDCTDPANATVELAPLPFSWRGIEWTDTQLVGALRLAGDFLEEAFPGRSFSPEDGFPQATND